MKDVRFVKHTELKTIFKYKYRQSLAGHKVRPAMVFGHAGIGKTQLVFQTAKELTKELGQDVQVLTMELLFKERPDFCGLSYVEEGVTKTANPDFFPTSNDTYGILYLSELNRVTDQGVRSGLLNLIENRLLNGRELGKHWMIICDGNLPEDAQKPGGAVYETIEMDAALNDRVVKYCLRGDPKETFLHLKSIHGNHPMMTFLENNPNFINYEGTGVTPRCFESLLHETPDWNEMPVELKELMLDGHYGPNAGAMVMSWFQKNDAPRFDEIKEGSKKAFDFLRSNPTRVDVFTTLSRAMVTYLFDLHRAKKKLDPDEKRNLTEYFAILSMEHKAALVVEMSKHSKAFAAQFSADFVWNQPWFEELNRIMTTTKHSQTA